MASQHSEPRVNNQSNFKRQVVEVVEVCALASERMTPDAPPLSAQPLDASAGESVADVLARFLADLDALEHCERNSSSERAPDAPPPLKRSKPKRKRVRTSSSSNASWKRQRDEIAALRSAIEALEAQRSVLQQRNEHRLCAGAPTTSAPLELRPAAAASDATLAALKRRLEREVAAHQRAVVERSRLLKLVEAAQKTALSINGAFAKHPLPLVADVLTVCPELRVLSANASAPIYSHLERLLDARCAKRQSFAPAAPLPDRPLTPSSLDSRVTHTHENIAVVTNSWLAPFSPDVVTDVLWRTSRASASDSAPHKVRLLRHSVSELRAPEPRAVQVEEAPDRQMDVLLEQVVLLMDSTLFVEKQLRLETAGETRDVVVYFVIKRYVDAHEQVTVAWESLGEWPSTDGSDAVFAVQGHGWGAVSRVPVASGSATCAVASRFCTSTVLEPVRDGDEALASAAALSDAHAKLFADAVVPMHQLGFAARMQVVENALLDLSLSVQRMGSETSERK